MICNADHNEIQIVSDSISPDYTFNSIFKQNSLLWLVLCVPLVTWSVHDHMGVQLQVSNIATSQLQLDTCTWILIKTYGKCF